MSEEDRRRFSETGGYGKLAANMTPAGYQGPMAHTYTSACSGHHPVGERCVARAALVFQPPNPEPDGTITIGPGAFASADRAVISWAGENYYRRDDAAPGTAGDGQPDLVTANEQLGTALTEARSSLASQVAENATLSRKLAEANAAIVALTPGAGETQFAVVEAMGHRVMVGRIGDVTIAGAPMIRVDRLDGRPQMLPAASVYMITPCTEAEARQAAGRVYGADSMPYALTAGAKADAWRDDEDPSNSDVDPDAYPDERDIDDEDGGE